jgi:hypothetical protein
VAHPALSVSGVSRSMPVASPARSRGEPPPTKPGGRTFRLRRAIFVVLVGSVVLNAALGIYALLASEFGEIQRNVLLTSLCVSGAGLLALACAPAFERGRVRPLPHIGAAAGSAGFALLAATVWLEDASGTLPEVPWKTAVTLIVVACGAANGSLLALARLAPRFRWTLTVAVGLSVLLAGLLVSATWGVADATWFARALGVVAVLLAAFTVLVPLLHRASRGTFETATPPTDGSVRFCPRCGEALTGAVDQELLCSGCGAGFVVSFRR